MNTKPANSEAFSRRRLLQGGAALSATTPLLGGRAWAKADTVSPTAESDVIIEMSATRLAELIRQRKVSAREAVEAYIARQIAVDDRLNAVVMNCYARARAEADVLDARAKRRDFSGPLHGVPMTIKDSFDTEGVISTGGTYGRQQYVPARDATVVSRLRQSGAILLGKTNTPEFTVGSVGAANTTGNMLHGTTHNPYDLTRSASGSSGGAAAIVAASGAAFDIGSDIGGSLRLPCHVSGVAGLKTTYGRAPRTGNIVDYGGVMDSWQQVGPIARRVKDLALIAPIMSGADDRDAACAPVSWRDPATVDLSKLRAAFYPDNGVAKVDPATHNTMMQAAAWLREVVADLRVDCPGDLIQQVHRARNKIAVGDGFAWYKRLAKKWGTNHMSPGMAETAEQTTWAISASEYARAVESADEAKSKLLTWFQSYDVLLCPVSGEPATAIDWAPGKTSDYSGALSDVGVFNSTGWPVAVVRCGTSLDGRLPIGVQVVAHPWREDIALAVASYLESRSGGWTPSPALKGLI